MAPNPLNYSKDDINIRPNKAPKKTERTLKRNNSAKDGSGVSRNPYSAQCYHSREYPPLRDRREVIEAYKQLPRQAKEKIERKARVLKFRISRCSGEKGALSSA